MRRLLRFLFLLLVAHPAAGQVVDTVLVRRVAERELDRLVGSPGAVMAIAVRDSTVWLGAFGQRHVESSEPMRAELLFGTAELDEVLVGLASAVLDATGGADLDAPIRTMIPDLPPRLGAVTLAQLLSHTAGLDDADDTTPPRRPVSRIWPEATDRAFFTDRGSIYSPSRYGLRLARAVLERHTGRGVLDLVHELILDPLGMTNSTFSGGRAGQLGAAEGYVVSTSAARPVVGLPPAENPHPQFFSSAKDLARLSRALLNGGTLEGKQVLPASAVAEVLRTRAARPSQPGDSVALGWTVTRFAGQREVGYSGGIAGYGILMRLLPEAGTAAVVLANGTGGRLSATADTALTSVLRSLGRNVARTRTTAAEDAGGLPADDAAFTGTYANGDRFILLEVRNGQLHWVDGDMALPVQKDGAAFHVIVADGRIAQTFRWARDAAGNHYLLVNDRAYRRTPR